MVSFKPENHCLSFTSTDVSALQLSRSLSSKVKYAIDLAKDKEGVLAWAQVGGLSDSSETGGVQNQGKKNNKRSRSGTDVVDYLEEKESEKGTVSRDRKKAKQS